MVDIVEESWNVQRRIENRAKNMGKGKYGMIGRAPFKGNQTHKIDTTLELPSKPKGLLVNAHHEVLAWDP